MADVKITDLPAAATLDGTELLEMVQANGSVKGTSAVIAALVPAKVVSVTGLNTNNTDPINPIVQIAIGTGLTGAGTSASPLVVIFPTKVSAVTGLNTDNTDPLNPIVRISTGTGISGNGTPGSPLTSSGGIITAKTILTSAQILAMGTIPVTLIAAQGAGNAINLLSIFMNLNFNTTGYTGASNLRLRINGQTILTNSSLLTQTSSQFILQMPSSATSNSAISAIGNQPLTVDTSNSNAVNGDSTITVYATYSIITL